MSSPIAAGQPYSPEETQRIIEQFNRDGYYRLGPVLAAGDGSKCQDADGHPKPDHSKPATSIRGVTMRMSTGSSAERRAEPNSTL